jgi:hypothetical protein
VQWRSPASSAKGARTLGGILPWKILKTRTLEMLFAAIWGLIYDNQSHWNKGYNFGKFNIKIDKKMR